MKVIVQRVTKASCKVDNKITGKIDQGFMILVGFGENDADLSRDFLHQMAKKIAHLRIFSDEAGKMNKSIEDIGGAILSISQFTLYANPYEGNRPSFTKSLNPTLAKEYYLLFNEILRKEYNLKVEEGIFGADMLLDIVCDGPVTIELEY